ncbi:MAG: lamin tail domain-containing protein [Bacteroidales bacterium]|nr:lamin tail domain-containing protein [Bacteroidales bacterium]
MRKIPVIIFFLIISLGANAQISCDFEELNFSEWYPVNPETWGISYEMPINGKFSLKHIYDNPLSGTDQVSLSTGMLELGKDSVSWKFKIRHGYNPSSSNNWAVFFAADKNAEKMIPETDIRGYAIGVNFSGSDDSLKIWKFSDNGFIEVLNTGLNWQETIGTTDFLEISILREGSGLWNVNGFINSDDTDCLTLGSFMDNEYLISRYFGIYYKYSSSQDRKLWFDDLQITGTFISDSTAPEIKSVSSIDGKTLEVIFSEPVDRTSAINTANYSVNHTVGRPESISFFNDSTVFLYFDTNFPSGDSCIIEIENVTDLNGNRMIKKIIKFLYHKIQRFDVVINEIMADPEPPLLLPEAEYIELYNRSNIDLNLNAWQLAVGDTRRILPEYNLKSKHYVVLINVDDTSTFEGYESILAVSKLPALNNTGKRITLFDKSNRLIHTVNYSINWYTSDYKKEGGWSLEMIDSDNPCAEEDNWCESIDKTGGTPGKINSVTSINKDIIAPFVKRAALYSDSSVILFFNESVDSLFLMNKQNYKLTPTNGEILEIIPVWPEFKAVILRYEMAFYKNVIYSITISGDISDCAGNTLIQPFTTTFAFPENAGNQDIVINEILFDPREDGVDFVEMYNRSEKIIDLKSLYVVSPDPFTNVWNANYAVTDEPYLFFPEEYICLTEDLNKVVDQYPNSVVENFIQVSGLPALPNESGSVGIVDEDNNLVDVFYYSEKMHHPLLQSSEGVSLERVNFNLPSNEPANWQSASEEIGFATPGYLNSQYSAEIKSEIEIQIEPKIFSPDDDGYNDIVNIYYSFSNTGYVTTIFIFDCNGNPVKTLASNMLSGTDGIISWNGRDEHNQKAGMGIYVILIKAFSPDGKIFAKKETCVLAPGY